VYGFMLLVAVILLSVTACVTIVGTYFLLNAENYHWQVSCLYSCVQQTVKSIQATGGCLQYSGLIDEVLCVTDSN
jgi:hypothetical protein